MERMTTIRSMLASDVEAMARMESANQPRPWTVGMFRDEFIAPGRTYLVVEDDVMVGFGGIQLIGEEAHVTNLLIDPDHRGRGLGRRLLKELIVSSIRQGARHLTLEVRVGNHAARSLYTSLGLAPVGVRPGYYDGDDALIMWVHDIDSPQYQERLR